MTFSERILRGRNAKNTFENETLNQAFDTAAEKWMRAIRAAPNQSDDILEAKRRIDAIQDVRATLKSWIEDGELAQIQQDEEDSNE